MATDKTLCEALTLKGKQCSRKVESKYCTQHVNFDIEEHKMKLCRSAFIAARIGEAQKTAIEEAELEWETLSKTQKESWIAKRQDYLDKKAQKAAEKSAEKEPKASTAQKLKCCGTTKKNLPCKSWAKHGDTHCVTHQVAQTTATATA